MDVRVCGSRSTVLATLGRPSRIPLASTQEALRTDVGLRFLPEPWMGTVLNILGNQMKPAGGLLWVNNCLLLVFCPQLPSCLYNYFSSLKFILSEIILVAYPEFSLIVCICVCVCVFVCVTYLQTSLKLSFQGTGGCILDQDPGDLNSASTSGSYYMSGLKQPLFLSPHNLKNPVNNGYFTRIL